MEVCDRDGNATHGQVYRIRCESFQTSGIEMKQERDKRPGLERRVKGLGGVQTLGIERWPACGQIQSGLSITLCTRACRILLARN